MICCPTVRVCLRFSGRETVGTRVGWTYRIKLTAGWVGDQRRALVMMVTRRSLRNYRGTLIDRVASVAGRSDLVSIRYTNLRVRNSFAQS